MKQHLTALAGLFLAVLLFLIGNGLINTLTPVRAHLELFSDLAIGVMGSAYFAGFLAGCLIGPHIIARVGYSHTFAMAAGLACAATLLQPLMIDGFVWVVLRAVIGFSAVNLFMTIESWLNDRATNETRGQIFSIYMTINYSGLIIGQAMLTLGDPRAYAQFNIGAFFYVICLIPLCLTRLPQPKIQTLSEQQAISEQKAGSEQKTQPTLRISPLTLFRVAPVGVMACCTVGLAHGAIWTLGPVYALANGLSESMVAIFMCVFVLGGALVQMPVGRFSDRMDRRIMIAITCGLSCMMGLLLALFGSSNHTIMLVLVALLGVTALPLYALATAHTNDRIPRKDFVAASACLLLVNALCSTIGPVIAALVTQTFGSSTLFFYTASIHAAMMVFTLIRMRMVEAAPDVYRDRFMPMPQQASQAALELDPRSPEHDPE